MRLFITTLIKQLVLLAGLAVIAAAMPGCGPDKYAHGAGESSFWVLAGTNRGEEFSRNSLAGYDQSGRQVIEGKIGRYYTDSMFLDHNGRLWLGMAWNDRETINKLVVWEDGKHVAELAVGMRPEAGLAEFDGKLVAGCAEMGFGFSLWQVDIDAVDSRQVTAVDKADRDFLMLAAIAANDSYLLVAAIHDDPDGSSTASSHTSLWWFDRDFTLKGSFYLGPDTAVWSIVPIADKFLLLNNSGFCGVQPDLLVFDPGAGEITETFRGSGFPYRGVAGNGKVYILDRIWSSVYVDSRRSLTILDGDNVTTTPLPDNLGAVDIAVDDKGQVYLAVWQRGNNDSDGVYRFDPATKKLEQIIRHPDASRVVINHPPASP